MEPYNSFLVAICIFDDTATEVPGIAIFIEDSLQVSALVVGGKLSELVFNCLALDKAQDGCECDFAKRGHFVVES